MNKDKNEYSKKKSGPKSQPPLDGSKMMTYGVNFTSMIKLDYKKNEQKYMKDTNKRQPF